MAVEASSQAMMGPQKRQLWSLSGSHMLNDIMTAGIVPALMPLYKEAFDLTYTQSGTIVLISYLVSSVMQPVFGLWTDRTPRPWLLPLGVFLTGLGLALSGFVPSYEWLLVVIALSGLGSGLFHPEASRGAHLAAGGAKGTAQAIFQVGGNAGQALGPLMLPLFVLSTGLPGLIWFLLFGAAGAWLMWRILPWYRERLNEERRTLKEVRGKNRPLGLVFLVLVVLLRSWTQIGIAGFLPFYYLHHQIPLEIGEIYTFLFLAAGAVGTFLGGKMSDRISHKWLLFGSMFLTVPFAWLTPLVEGPAGVVMLIIFGFFVLSSFAVTVVYGQRLLPGKVGLVSGLMIGFGVGAGGIGATFLGWIADRYGVPFVLEWIFLLPLLGSLLTLFIPDSRKLETA
ncbi:MFS transporter [Kroppenstedtia eburnea]|nr:MFS transporter [Kroppenstedtia eburnea]EGK13397.1 MFS family major facilitator transporter, fosmidomycin:cation antiporter [Desmospora sp. 8437]